MPQSPLERQLVSSGSTYEQRYGYSRAVRVGNTIYVSGTTGLGADGKVVGPGAYAQAVRALEIIAAALEQAGGSLQGVVRTRLYVTNTADAADVLRAHGEAFGEIRPATALVGVTGLISPDMVVEIEADCVV
jgi:enamine deaminase RidA (YjgF/YER057c/UK114 family)